MLIFQCLCGVESCAHKHIFYTPTIYIFNYIVMSTVSIPNKSFDLAKLGGLFNSKSLSTKGFINFLLPITSIIIFILLWSVFANSLYNAEAKSRIAKANDPKKVEALTASAKNKITGEYIILKNGETLPKDIDMSKVYAVASQQENGKYKVNLSLEPAELEYIPNSLPGPLQIKNALISLILDHKNVMTSKKEFKEKSAAANAQLEAQGKKGMTYTGRPSFVNQVLTSIKTVFFGVILASFIAIPLGIFIGLSERLRLALNWFIQIFKPVSPVVWFLLVYMVTKTILRDSDTDKAFINSLISVSLCSMWATLVNTAMGVASVDKDFMNVASVLRLNTLSKVFKIVLPSALPLIFTGLRITVSVAWMVLIAIELLAQSPGLGLFVWEEFQNGSNESNAKIIVAMFVIGIIGFLLDRIMMSIQKSLSFK